MESLFQQQAAHFYNQVLESNAIFSKIKQIEFSTQPKEVIYQENKLILYRYRSRSRFISSTPLLVVFALINRPEILDLSPDCSFISGLLEAGRDVYLLDWGYPSPEDKNLALEDYLFRYMKNVITQIKQKSGRSSIDLLGICQGGVFSLVYASLFPEDLRNLVLISTPVDFQTPQDLLSRFAQGVEVEKLANQLGNIPGAWLAQIFSGMSPFHLIGKKYLKLLDSLADGKAKTAWLQQFFLMERWLNDTPNQAGRAFAQFVKLFYQENRLLRNTLQLNGRHVDLKSITLPILNVIGGADTIVPPQASRILGKHIQSVSYSQTILPAGHIGLYVSQKTKKRLPKLIASWLKKMESRA